MRTGTAALALGIGLNWGELLLLRVTLSPDELYRIELGLRNGAAGMGEPR